MHTSRSPRTRANVLALTLVLAVAFGVAACGSSSAGTDAVASGASDQGTTATTAPATQTMEAYRQCLQDHGITMPERRTPGSAAPNGTAGSGATGSASGSSGSPGPRGTIDPATQEAARAACGTAPAGGRGQGQGAAGPDPAAMTAFRECMAQNGVTIPDQPAPSGASGSSGTVPRGQGGRGGGLLGGLDRNDPTVAAALEACQANLPGGFGAGGPGGGPGGPPPDGAPPADGSSSSSDSGAATNT